MIVFILALIAIGLAIIERVLYIKKKKSENFNKVRLLLKLFILGLMFMISYYVTDTTGGLVYVFLSICMSFIIAKFNYKNNKGLLKYFFTAIEAILVVYLIIKANQNMLISISYIFLTVTILMSILSSPDDQNPNFKQVAVNVATITLVMGLVFVYQKLPGSKDLFVVKKERVAKNFIKKELNLSGFEIYPDIFDRALRGEEAQIRAYDPSETRINMVYKDGEIIRYTLNEPQKELFQ